MCPHTAPDTWRDGYTLGFSVKPPPTMVVTDVGDPLRDEGLACAKSILDAGCPDFLHLEGAASHTFTMLVCPPPAAFPKWAGFLKL